MSQPPIRTVLAATDLSDSSDGVLRSAARLARATGASLHVVHAFELPPPAPLGDVPAALPDIGFWEGRMRDAEHSLDAQLARALEPGTDAESRRLEVYAAHRAIAERAEQVGADLVVLGPHRRHRMGDALLGSTADRVLRTVSAPCLVLRGELRLPLRTVVVPVDLSDPARAALHRALVWAATLGASDGVTGLPAVTVRVVHVLPRMLAGDDVPFDRASVDPQLNREVRAALERARGAAAVDVEEEVVWGDRPADRIVSYAEEVGADLIAMGTHGTGFLRRALIGSVASGVARTAPCPVLLVPPRAAQEGRSAAGEDVRRGA